jgi:ferredoxin
MEVTVDESKCQGHLRCVQAVPSVFDEDEQGHAVVLVKDVPVELEEQVRDAAWNCPEQAITVD